MGEYQEKLEQLWHAWAEKMKESWQLRTAMFATFAVLAAVAFFVATGEGEESAESVAFSEGSLQKTQTVPAKQTDIIGMAAATEKKNLRNPFLPDHPDLAQQKVLRETVGNLATAAEAKKQGTQLGQAGTSSPATGNGSEEHSKTADKAKQTEQIRLQGIIQSPDGAGVLLLIGTNTELLLAGECIGGCTLQEIGNDKAVIMAGGKLQNLQVGDNVQI